MLIADMHIHSNNSHDAVSSLSEICDSAIKKGIKVLAITDHLDVVYCERSDVFSCIRSSYSDVVRAREKYGKEIDILAGIEIGDPLMYPEFSKECANALDYDVIIGSVHTVCLDDCTDPYSMVDFSRMDAEFLHRFIHKYFDELCGMLADYDFDIFAHLTCPFRYINGKYGRDVDIRKYADRIDDVLRRVIEKGVALEVNTSGYGTSVGFMPDEWIVERYVSFGGKKVTLGSDAHIADNIGKGFDAAIQMLKRHGIDYIYSFKKRKPVIHEI